MYGVSLYNSEMGWVIMVIVYGAKDCPYLWLRKLIHLFTSSLSRHIRHFDGQNNCFIPF